MHDDDNRSDRAVLALISGNMILRQEQEPPLCPQLESIRVVPRNTPQSGHHATLFGQLYTTKAGSSWQRGSKENIFVLNQ